MCPLCDEKIGCAYWYLSDVCTYVKIAYLFDHPATVAYAVFVSFWGEIAKNSIEYRICKNYNIFELVPVCVMNFLYFFNGSVMTAHVNFSDKDFYIFEVIYTL